MRLIPIYTWNKGILNASMSGKRFSKQPWAQGVLLLGCVLLAMLLANLPFTKEVYHDILGTTISRHFQSPSGAINISFPVGMTVESFINDVLMVIFFFTVGLEIRREISYGELSTPKKAFLPIIAAFGGALCPALIYTLINHGNTAASGWGIPTATDIAFVVCILTVLGNRVPVSLKVFLTALAIADDLIAILVVAIFYGGNINLPLLLIAVAVILLTVLLRQIGEKKIFPYLLCAFVVWILFYYSGIHATMTGVVMAFLIPGKPRYNESQFKHKWKKYEARLFEYDNLEDDNSFPNGPQRHFIRVLGSLGRGSMTMTDRLESALSPWVNFVIMPIFALANAGVELAWSDASAGITSGIFFGLLLGKPLGITLSSWLAIKLGAGEMPAKASWPMFFAVACLGGIGFTMSIFVDTLSFGGFNPAATAAMRDAGKVAVLMGSVAAAILGSVLVCLLSKRSKK